MNHPGGRTALRYRARLAAALLLCFSGMAAQAQTAPDAAAQLARVLAQMDVAAAKFQTAQADFTWDQLTAVVQEHDIQKGTIKFRRTAKDTAMVMHVATENGAREPKDVLFDKGQLELYQPGLKQETILQAGDHRGQFETYVTLGFGGSGKDLAAQWNVSYAGTETIDGAAVAKLQLAPKKPDANQMFTGIEIWIDPATATSRRQVFHTAGGDTRTAVYTNIKLNSTPGSAFSISIPRGTTIFHK